MAGDSTRFSVALLAPSGGGAPPVYPSDPIFQTDGTVGVRIPCTVDGTPEIAVFGGVFWGLASPSVVSQAYVAANPMPPGAGLPALADYALALPGSLNLAGPVQTFRRSRIIHVYVPGLDQAFGRVRIGLLNRTVDTPYTLHHLSVGRASDTALTENPSTGFVTLQGSDVAVPPGTNLHPTDGTAIRPGVWRSAWHSITPAGGNWIRIAIDLGANHPLHNWGAFPGRYGIGWTDTQAENLAGNLAESWSITGGGQTYGELPLLFVEFDQLAQSVVPLAVVGDSHPNGYGDGDQPFRPHGITGRLHTRWRAAGVRIAPVNLACVGNNTAEIAQRVDWILDTFDVRLLAIQAFSVNNISRGTFAQFRTDFPAAVAAVQAKGAHFFPFLGCGMNGMSVPNWSAMLAEQEWAISNYPETHTGSRTRCVNQTTGAFQAGMGYEDGGHLSDLGHTTYEEDSYAGWKALADAKAGTTL